MTHHRPADLLVCGTAETVIGERQADLSSIDLDIGSFTHYLTTTTTTTTVSPLNTLPIGCPFVDVKPANKIQSSRLYEC